MPNAPHILETALLLLVAFLIGCVAGFLARRISSRRPPATDSAAIAAAAPATGAVDGGAQLVVAPKIQPIAAPKPASAQPASVLDPAVPPPVEAIQPARVAGQATSGRVIPAPVEQPAAPDVEPGQPEMVVVAAEVPQINEAAHVVEPEPSETEAESPVVTTAQEPGPAVGSPAATDSPIEISWSELSGRPTEPAPRSRLETESEDAAMRAVEGGWTPRAAPIPSSRPVELPEPIQDERPVAPSAPAAATTNGPSAAEIAGALSAARSAVEAASAAADAALAEYVEPRAEAADSLPLPGEAEKAAADPDGASPEAVAAAGGKATGHAPFGRPAGLAGPRDGHKDDLRQIKGLSLQIEAALNDLGIFHFDQIAAWDKKSTVWIDTHLALKGSLARDRWVEQARELGRSRGNRTTRR